MTRKIFNKSKKMLMSAVLLAACTVTAVPHSVSATATENTKYATGCIPDSKAVLIANLEIDDRALANSENLPSSIDLTNQFPIPKNQGSQGSCTAWAVGYAMKSHQEYVEHGWNLSDVKTQCSPSYIYNQINNGVDRGSSISNALNLLVNEGVCSLYNMPYNQYDYTSQPNSSQEDIASNFKAADWHTILGVSAVKDALASNQGVVISIGCYTDFDNISSNNDTYDVINSNDTTRGRHAICLIGYDDANQRFKFINSWGTNWGLSGYGYISYDMFTDSRNSSGWGYVIDNESHSDSTKFYTNNPQNVKTLTNIRAYTSPDYYANSTDNYDHTISAGTVIGIDEFVSSSNGRQPYFKTSDGYYINAQKTQLQTVSRRVFINGNGNNSINSMSSSETSSISFTPNSSTQYNNHNTLKINYTVNQSDSYNGYAGAKITADSSVTIDGDSAIGFWYMTPASQQGTIAFCMQGSVNKKIVQLPTTGGEWRYYSNNYNFTNSTISDIEIFINGNESNCVTTPSTGTIYIAELSVIK